MISGYLKISLFVIGFGPFSFKANGKDNNIAVMKSEGISTNGDIFVELNLSVVSRRPSARIIIIMRNILLCKNYCYLVNIQDKN